MPITIKVIPLKDDKSTLDNLRLNSAMVSAATTACGKQLIQRTHLVTRNSPGDEIAKRDFSVYLFIAQLYINSCCTVNK